MSEPGVTGQSLRLKPGKRRLLQHQGTPDRLLPLACILITFCSIPGLFQIITVSNYPKCPAAIYIRWGVGREAIGEGERERKGRETEN